MRRILAVLFVLTFIVSCSESPPARQALQPNSPAEEPATKSPAADPPAANLPDTNSPDSNSPDTNSPNTNPPAEQVQTDVPATDIPAVEPPVEEVARLGVGDQAPNFRLQDQAGDQHTLESMLADGQVALVFHRSADW